MPLSRRRWPAAPDWDDGFPANGVQVALVGAGGRRRLAHLRARARLRAAERGAGTTALINPISILALARAGAAVLRGRALARTAWPAAD